MQDVREEAKGKIRASGIACNNNLGGLSHAESSLIQAKIGVIVIVIVRTVIGGCRKREGEGIYFGSILARILNQVAQTAARLRQLYWILKCWRQRVREDDYCCVGHAGTKHVPENLVLAAGWIHVPATCEYSGQTDSCRSIPSALGGCLYFTHRGNTIECFPRPGRQAIALCHRQAIR